MTRQWRRNEFSGIILLAASFALVALVVAGYVAGAYFDRVYGTGPRWTAVGLALGFLIGMWNLYLVSSRLLAAQPRIEQPRDADPDDMEGTREDNRESGEC